jgi:hypothetical protein
MDEDDKVKIKINFLFGTAIRAPNGPSIALITTRMNVA